MKIVHVCQFSLIPKNGIQAAVWELAEHQVRLGHEVEILSPGRKPAPDEVEACAKHGVKLQGASSVGEILQLIREFKARPEIPFVHMHSVFIPWNGMISMSLLRRGSPYAISPHGNLNPEELARKRLKKIVYMTLILRRNLTEAGSVICVSEQECRHIRQLVPNANPLLLGNGVDFAPFEGAISNFKPNANAEQPVRALFMGKSDVYHKGLDRMFEVASTFPGGVDFYVIPHNQQKLLNDFERMAEKYRSNSSVRVHKPVYGDDKPRAYLNAHCYLHLARWEVFGMVLIEAAYSGLPIVISQECDLAEPLAKAGAALVVDCNQSDYPQKIREWIASPEFRSAGHRGREWALRNYSSQAVAAKSIEIYGETIRRFQKERGGK